MDDKIIQTIVVSSSVANSYLQAGWNFLNSKPNPNVENEKGFFILLGRTDKWSAEDFENFKQGLGVDNHSNRIPSNYGANNFRNFR